MQKYRQYSLLNELLERNIKFYYILLNSKYKKYFTPLINGQKKL